MIRRRTASGILPLFLPSSRSLLSPRSQLRTCKFPPLPLSSLSLSLSPFPILTTPMKPWSASLPPVSCPSLSLQHFTLAVWDAGWSGEGRYGARCPSGLTVLIHPWSAPLPPDPPSHSSPLPRCGTGHRVEWRRKAWSKVQDWAGGGDNGWAVAVAGGSWGGMLGV